MRRAGKLFDCPRVPSAISMHVLSNMEYFAPVWTPSAEYHLSLLDSVVLCAESLVYRRKVSALSLLYKIYHRADHLLPE